MKKSELNLMVIENFILHITHSSDYDDKTPMTFTPSDLYKMAHDYIEEDHVDGKDGDDTQPLNQTSMKELGYFALERKANTLYPFEWGKNNEFYIIKDNVKTLSDVKEFEILEIGFYKA